MSIFFYDSTAITNMYLSPTQFLGPMFLSIDFFQPGIQKYQTKKCSKQCILQFRKNFVGKPPFIDPMHGTNKTFIQNGEKKNQIRWVFMSATWLFKNGWSVSVIESATIMNIYLSSNIIRCWKFSNLNIFTSETWLF